MEWNVEMRSLRKEDPCEVTCSPQNTTTAIYIVENFCDFFFPVGLDYIAPLRYQHGGSVLSPRYCFSSVLLHTLTDLVIPALLHLTDPYSCSTFILHNSFQEKNSSVSFPCFRMPLPSLIPDEIKYFWPEGGKEKRFRKCTYPWKWALGPVLPT